MKKIIVLLFISLLVVTYSYSQECKGKKLLEVINVSITSPKVKLIKSFYFQTKENNANQNEKILNEGEVILFRKENFRFYIFSPTDTLTLELYKLNRDGASKTRIKSITETPGDNQATYLNFNNKNTAKYKMKVVPSDDRTRGCGIVSIAGLTGKK